MTMSVNVNSVLCYDYSHAVFIVPCCCCSGIGLYLQPLLWKAQYPKGSKIKRINALMPKLLSLLNVLFLPLI